MLEAPQIWGCLKAPQALCFYEAPGSRHMQGASPKAQAPQAGTCKAGASGALCHAFKHWICVKRGNVSVCVHDVVLL